jgi:magnesium-transporting ATPase (P-type)
VSTTTINEELGQIEYVLTDKTGTLTQNKMILRALSIGQKVFGAKIEKLQEKPLNKKNFDQELLDIIEGKVVESLPKPMTLAGFEINNPPEQSRKQLKKAEAREQPKLAPMKLQNSYLETSLVVSPEKTGKFKSALDNFQLFQTGQGEKQVHFKKKLQRTQVLDKSRDLCLTDLSVKPLDGTLLEMEEFHTDDKKIILKNSTLFQKKIVNKPPETKENEETRRVREEKKSETELYSYKELSKEFLICASLCHECLIERNQEGKFVKYEGSSPDEIAICKGLRDIGVEFKGTVFKVSTVQYFDQLLKFERKMVNFCLIA